MRRIVLAGLAVALSLPALAQQGPGGPGNFTPNFGATQIISATTGSSAVTFAADGVDATRNSELMIYNAGTGLAFCRWGNGNQTALATDVPIPSGTVQVFYKNKAPTGTTQQVACITTTGTASVYVLTGQGR